MGLSKAKSVTSLSTKAGMLWSLLIVSNLLFLVLIWFVWRLDFARWLSWSYFAPPIRKQSLASMDDLYFYPSSFINADILRCDCVVL